MSGQQFVRITGARGSIIFSCDANANANAETWRAVSGSGLYQRRYASDPLPPFHEIPVATPQEQLAIIRQFYRAAEEPREARTNSYWSARDEADCIRTVATDSTAEVYHAKGTSSYRPLPIAAARIGGGNAAINILVDSDGQYVEAYESSGRGRCSRRMPDAEGLEVYNRLLACGHAPQPLGLSTTDRIFGVHG